jgi:hypothetical protein
MKTRRLTAETNDGRVETRTTHRPYTHVVFYFDGRRPTWHGSLELAQRKATNADTIVRCQEA